MTTTAAPLRLLIFCLLAPFLLNLPLYAQSGPGQYEDEAPLRSWTRLGPLSASAAGMGGPRAARASDYMAILVNPALSSLHPAVTLTISGGLATSELNKFSFVNTGVVTSEGNLALSVTSLDFAGFSIQHRGWGLAVNLSLFEDYSRPEISTETEFEGDPYHQLDFLQRGLLRNFHVSLSRRINRWLAVGLGFNILYGDFERRWEERYLLSRVTITDIKQHDFSGSFLSAGALLQPLDNLNLAAYFRSPTTLKADSRSELSNRTAPSGLDFEIDVDGESRFHRPLVLGAGFDWRIVGPLNLAADVTYLNWSSYRADYFEESLNRDFRDVVLFHAGIEFRTLTTLFGRAFVFPIWLGFRRDPQPMRDPISSYSYLTFGTGIRSRVFYVDLSSHIGFERGSGDDLNSRKTTLSIGLVF